MYRCWMCLGPGVGCSCQIVRVVRDRDIQNPEFVRDVRNFAAALPVPPSAWLDYTLDKLARFDGFFVDQRGKRIALPTDLLLPTDEEIDAGNGGEIEERIRNWFVETFATPVPSGVTPRVRREAWERFRIVATILKAASPEAAMMWGVRAANDNARLALVMS